MKTAICCIVKNEHMFIKEWVDHHLNIGIDSIYIFEDFSSDSHAELFLNECYNDKVFILPLIDNDLGIIDTHSTDNQRQVYKYFLNSCKTNKFEYDWVLFIDVDEFLMFEDNYDLKRLLDECKDFSAILLTWKVYGASFRIKSPHPYMGVIDAYTIPTDKPFENYKWAIKSFVNTKKCKGLINNHEALDGKLTNGLHYTSVKEFCYEKAWLNHYFTKSWEDYCNRMFSRGNMFNINRAFDEFFIVNKDFEPLRKELIDGIRHKHLNDTMWIDKKLMIISGGNENKLNEIKKLMDNA